MVRCVSCLSVVFVVVTVRGRSKGLLAEIRREGFLDWKFLVIIAFLIILCGFMGL